MQLSGVEMNKTFIDRSKLVMRSLALRKESFDFARQNDGEVALVVAMPNEHLKDVLKRVENIDGPFNIILADAVGFEILPVHAKASDFKVMVVSPDISMGMLAIKLRRHPGTTVRLDVEERSDLTAEVAILPQIAYA